MKTEVATTTNEQIVLDRVDKLGLSVEEIKQVVNTLTEIIINQSPNIVDMNTRLMPMFSPMSQYLHSPIRTGDKIPCSIPLVIATFSTPKNSSLSNQSPSNSMMGKLKSVVDQRLGNDIVMLYECSRPTQQSLGNAKESIYANRNKSTTEVPSSKDTNGKLIGMKLFNSNNQGTPISRPLRTKSSPSGYYIYYQSPPSMHIPTRTIGINLPSRVTVLFRPPREMVLNEEEVAVVSYLFGTNKNDKSNSKE